MMNFITRPISAIGSFFIWWIEFTGGLGYLLRDTAGSVHTALFATRGRRLGWQNLWAQMVRVGVRSIPIISLVVFCIGAILALQMAPILDEYGALSQVADIIGIAMFRELGPLVAAIVLTGFAGASIAAELGTMRVSEQIDALETMAYDPVAYLVVPRILAGILMFPIIVAFANTLGIFSGMITAVNMLDMSTQQFIRGLRLFFEPFDVVYSSIKTMSFGFVVTLIGCYQGFNTQGGAEGVGIATTRAVVTASVLILVLDAFWAVVLL